MDVKHDEACGQAEVWNNLATARAFDHIAGKNPLHNQVFDLVLARLRKIKNLGLVLDAGGGTGLLAQQARREGIAVPFRIIDPGKDGTVALASEKNIAGVTIQPVSFEQDQRPRRGIAKVSAVATYVLHNFSPEIRREFFIWLHRILKTGETFIMGDTVADSPIGNVRRDTQVDMFLSAVGAEHWQDDPQVPEELRQRILKHTREDDPRTAPDFTEITQLARDFGFAYDVQKVSGFLHVITFTKQ